MKKRGMRAVLLTLALVLGLGVLLGRVSPAAAAEEDEDDTIWPYVHETIETDFGRFFCKLWMGGPDVGTVWIDGIWFTDEIRYHETYHGTKVELDLVYPSELVVGDLHYPIRRVDISEYAITEYVDVLSVTVPDSVYWLGPKRGIVLSEGFLGFYGYSLKSVHLGANVRNAYALFHMGKGYSHEVDITISPDNPYYKVVDNVIYSKDGKTLAWVQGSKVQDGTFHIPDTVTTIGKGAFKNDYELTSIVLPDSVTYVDDYAFYQCDGVEHIRFSPNLTYIGRSAFAGLHSWAETIDLPDSITALGADCFASDVKAPVGHISNRLTVIPEGAFYGCGPNPVSDDWIPVITGGGPDIVIPDNVLEIGDYAFCSTNSSHITLPKNLKRIGAHAFDSNFWETDTLVLPDSVVFIGDEAFKWCKFKHVVLPQGLRHLGEGVFAACASLESVNIPPAITHIPNGAFWECTNLEIQLPDTVEIIGSTAFARNEGTKNLVIPDSVVYIDKGAFGAGCYETIRLSKHLNDASELIFNENGYENGYMDNDGAKELVVPDSMTQVWSFDRMYKLETITIPASVTKIDEDDLEGCHKLTTVKGYPGSAAETWAKEKGYTFVPLSNPPATYPITLEVTNNITSYNEVAYGLDREEAPADSVVSFSFYASPKNVKSITVTSASGANIPVKEFKEDFAFDHRYFIMPAEPVTVRMEFADPSALEIVSAGIAPADSGTAIASTQSVDVLGHAAVLQAYALADASGNQTNYVKARDVAALLDETDAQFDVQWNEWIGAVNLVAGSRYNSRNGSENQTPYSGNRAYTKSTAITKVNYDTEVSLQAFVLTDDAGGGHTYYKLRDLGQALGFNVGWSADRGIYIEPGVPYSFDD